MADEKPGTQNQNQGQQPGAGPDAGSDPGKGKPHPVDQKVQEEAAKEREDKGGYQ
jgi:hypothetical protein